MTSYLLKWCVAALIMPLMTLFFGKLMNQLVILFFWPSSIFLASLGAEERAISDVFYVWGVAISVNILIYLFIGVVFYFVKSKFGGDGG